MEGRPEKILSKLRSDWAGTVIANWSLWIPAQYINFKYIPIQFQVLFSNSVGFIWNLYLSSVTYKKNDFGHPTTGTTTSTIATTTTNTTTVVESAAADVKDETGPVKKSKEPENK